MTQPFAFAAVACALAATCADAATITTFTVPDARDLTVTAMNNAGDVTGYYMNTSYLYVSFVRLHDGSIQTFDASGDRELVNQPKGINDAGTVVGTLVSGPSTQGQGFIRTADGTITTYDVPAARPMGTVLTSIDKAGDIAGYYYPPGPKFPASGSTGFLLSASGVLSTFRPAGDTPDQSVQVTGMNDNQQVIGFTVIAEADTAFLRNADNTVQSIDVSSPRRLQKVILTEPSSINDSGAVTGALEVQACVGQKCKPPQPEAYVQLPGQPATIFLPPNAINVGATFINASGVVAGTWFDTQPLQATHGFVRDAAGNVTEFDVPGTVDTQVGAINDAGMVAGTAYVDEDAGTSVGFVYTP